ARGTSRGARARGPPRPAAPSRWRGSRLGWRQAMKTFDCSLGARAAVLCAVASLAVAAAASADETAYLMYLKGSEGPPAVPMRVPWDARDRANGPPPPPPPPQYRPTL